MAMEYFKERIEPTLPEIPYFGADFLDLAGTFSCKLYKEWIQMIQSNWAIWFYIRAWNFSPNVPLELRPNTNAQGPFCSQAKYFMRSYKIPRLNFNAKHKLKLHIFSSLKFINDKNILQMKT